MPFHEAVVAALAFGSLWYCIVTGIWIILMFWCVEGNNNFFSAVWFVLYLAFLQFLVKADFFSYIAHHPINTLLYIVGYLALGLIWSFIKWWMFTEKQAIIYKEKRCKWLCEMRKDLESRKGRTSQDEKLTAQLAYLENIELETQVPDFLMEEWKRRLSYSFEVPQVHNNKEKIAIWITYWPISLIWSLINDFIKKFVRTLVMKFKDVYQGITMSSFKGIEKL